VDGLIRYRLNDASHGAVADLIRWANAQTAPILVLDILSWVDGASGTVFDQAIGETVTMTLAMPKAASFAPEARALVGELYRPDQPGWLACSDS